MSGIIEESPVEKILKEIGLTGYPRDEALMKCLAQAIIHPGEVVNSTYLCEDDQLKVSAHLVMDDFEAVTNGMGRREQKCETVFPASEDPFGPWRTLTNAIVAFYSGDIVGMKKIADTIPHDTAAAV